MSLRNYGWLIGTTLLVGGIAGVFMGMTVASKSLYDSTLANFFVGIFMHLLYGMTISIVAQMGFFAFMMLNYMVLTPMKNKILRNNIQLFFVAFVFFDIVYLRSISFGDGGSILPYLLEPTLLLVVAVATAFAKVKVTNPTAWIPTLFFMFVVTAIEWIPALRQEEFAAAATMVVPLLCCNAWQIMQLQRVTNRGVPGKTTKAV
ncbi:KinB-signaling pathway activation protein [Brevibacillus daliensis]|uniref:KinB-signaling pathway activation protein n=1 Tax=Brevibacillus daliensis TaxID=2892995 RepID=UPI001E3129A8|nr:KinB-signaling pathway activation protein [Brevibacillus daliensis]